MMQPSSSSSLWLPQSVGGEKSLPHSRRSFLKTSLLTATTFSLVSLHRSEGLLAEQLIQTPRMTEGPFYPDKLPLDTDNDLLIVNNSITPAVGTVTHLSGRVLSKTGLPIRNAFIEIWQVDSKGSYLHTQGGDLKTKDGNFQGYGRFLTDVQGRYYFRTVKPVPYRLFGLFRAPHIHIGISKNGKRIFTTQLLINGHPDNKRDGLFQQIRDPQLKKTIVTDFKPLPNSKIGELTANFDIVLGYTIQELEDGTIRGGIGSREFKGRFRPR